MQAPPSGAQRSLPRATARRWTPSKIQFHVRIWPCSRAFVSARQALSSGAKVATLWIGDRQFDGLTLGRTCRWRKHLLRGKSLTPCLGSDVHQPLHRAIHECLFRLQCLLTQRAVATDTWPQLQSLFHQDTISHLGFALKYPLPCNAMDKLLLPYWAAISDHHCSFWVRNTLLGNMSSDAWLKRTCCLGYN